MSDTNVFDPVAYSLAENQFLLDHIGEPPVVARRAISGNINPRAVMPVIEKVYSLEQLKSHEGTEWTGIPLLKEKIAVYIKAADRWAADKARHRGAPRFPSMNSYDARRRAHPYGPGSDTGQVRTYFGDAGERIPFAVEYVPTGAIDWSPSWVQADRPARGLTVNQTLGRIECDICGHTESYKIESRASYNAARGRISKHLRSTTDDPDSHRELYTAEFGG